MKNLNFAYFLKTLLIFVLFIAFNTSCAEEADEGMELVGVWEGFSDTDQAPNDFQVLDLFTIQLPVEGQRSGTWQYRVEAKSNCNSSTYDCNYEYECSGFLVFKSKARLMLKNFDFS